MISPERRSEITLSNIGADDCGVIAIQAVTGWKRERAAKFAKEECGYRPGHGTPVGKIDAALIGAGFKVEAESFYRNATPATFSLTHEYGVFLLYIDGHVMGLVDGDLYNARSHWGKPLLRAVRVERQK